MKRLRHLLPALLIVAAAGCHKPSADEHFAKGNDFFDHGRTADAILEYRAALQVDVKRGDIHTKLSDAYLKAGDLRNAIVESIRAADVLPKDIKAQIRAGSMLLVARQFEDANSRADKALALDPNNPEALILKGNARASLKDLDGAMADYQQALTFNPNQDAAYENIAAIQTAKKQTKEAEANFRKAVEVAPKSVQARLALANFLWASGRRDDAERTLKDALQIDPSDSTANRALGVFYIASGRVNEAEPYFQAIAKTQASTAATLSLADYYVYAKRFDDARKVLNGLAGKDEGYAVATTRLAAIDAAQGLRAPAEAKLHQVLDKKPKEMPARLLLARLLAADGNGDEALKESTSITADDPNSATAGEAYLVIGQVQAARDHREEAIAAYLEALKRQASPAVAALSLAALDMTGGELDKAQTFVQQAQAIAPRSPQVRAMNVRLLLARGDTTKAKAEIETLQKDYPNSPTVMELVASQQMATKQYDAARASYTRALSAAPGDLSAVAGLVEIDLATGHPKDAVARIEAGLKNGTASGDYLVLAAKTYGMSGNLPRAEELLKQTIEQYPTRLAAYGLLGQLYVAQKRLPEAETEFKELVQRNPKSVPSGTMLGMLYEALGKGPEAEKQYQAVLALDPRAAVAANNLAWRYADSNRDLDQALQLAQTAHQVLPDEPHVNDTLGWAYYRKGLFPQAATAFEASLQKDKTDPAVYYHEGMALVRSGDLSGGKEQLRKALSFGREFPGISETRATLAQLGKQP